MFSRISALACLVATLCATPVTAQQQSCSDLTISGNTKAGGELVIHVKNADLSAPIYLAISGKEGTTNFNLGAAGSLTLGLAQPIVFIPLGTTTPGGTVNFKIPVPQDLTTELTLFAQAVSVTGNPSTPRLEFCTSEVVQFTVGG